MVYCCYYENTDSCPHNGILFVWLVPVVPTLLKGEWSTAVMECGGLLITTTLIQEMVKWCVDNLDTKIHVS